MRLIDADLIQYEPMLSAKGNGMYEDIMVAYKSQIDDLPSVQPEDKCGECDAWNQYKNYPRQRERKTGKWITMADVYGIYWVCSVCGEDIPRIEHFNSQFDLFPRLESIDKTYFCPNCGARMEI